MVELVLLHDHLAALVQPALLRCCLEEGARGPVGLAAAQHKQGPASAPLCQVRQPVIEQLVARRLAAVAAELPQFPQCAVALWVAGVDSKGVGLRATGGRSQRWRGRGGLGAPGAAGAGPMVLTSKPGFPPLT